MPEQPGNPVQQSRVLVLDPKFNIKPFLRANIPRLRKRPYRFSRHGEVKREGEIAGYLGSAKDKTFYILDDRTPKGVQPAIKLVNTRAGKDLMGHLYDVGRTEVMGSTDEEKAFWASGIVEKVVVRDFSC